MEKTISECDREIDELLDLIQFLTNENRFLKVLGVPYSLPQTKLFLPKTFIIAEIIKTFFQSELGPEKSKRRVSVSKPMHPLLLQYDLSSDDVSFDI